MILKPHVSFFVAFFCLTMQQWSLRGICCVFWIYVAARMKYRRSPTSRRKDQIRNRVRTSSSYPSQIRNRRLGRLLRFHSAVYSSRTSLRPRYNISISAGTGIHNQSNMYATELDFALRPPSFEIWYTNTAKASWTQLKALRILDRSLHTSFLKLSKLPPYRR